MCDHSIFLLDNFLLLFFLLLKVLESMNIDFKGENMTQENSISRLNSQWFNIKQNMIELSSFSISLFFFFPLVQNKNIGKHMRLQNLIFLKVNKWSQKIMREDRNADSYDTNYLDLGNNFGTCTKAVEFYPPVWIEIQSLQGLKLLSLFPFLFPVFHIL